MIVRDLLINFGAKFDGKQAEGQIQGFAQTAKGAIGAILGIQFVRTFASVTGNIIDMASAVVENANVMSASFGENEDRVKSWAKTFGDSAGRSRFEMEAMAGSMGGLLLPMLDQNKEKAADMSIGLSKLAVDLASFYNIADDQTALMKLRSGISGESEPLKALGVNMTEAALQEFARTQGIRKKVKAMKIAEKTELRYQYILANTKHVQGDAIKTADQLANAKRGLISKFKELIVTGGMRFIPVAGKVVKYLKDGVTWFGKAAEKSHIFEAALITLGAVAGVIALKLLAPFLPLILGILAAIVVIDDLWTLFKGGDSIIGRFINYIAGPGSAKAAVEWMKEAAISLVNWLKTDGKAGFIAFKDGVVSFVTMAWPYVKRFFGGMYDAISYVGEKMGGFVGWLVEHIFPMLVASFKATWAILSVVMKPVIFAIEKLIDLITWLWGLFSENVLPVIKEVAEFLSEVLVKALTAVVDTFTELYNWVAKSVDKLGDLSGMTKAVGDFFGFDWGGSDDTPMTSKRTRPIASKAPLATVPQSVFRGAGNYTDTTEIHQSTEVHLSGTAMNPQTVADKTRDAVAKENKRTFAALKRKRK